MTERPLKKDPATPGADVSEPYQSGTFQVTSDVLAPSMPRDPSRLKCPADDCLQTMRVEDLVDGWTCPDCGATLVLDVVWAAQGDADDAGGDGR